MLEPILFYHASKCKQTKEKGSEDSLWTHNFTFLCDCCQLFFFFVQDANKPESKCPIKRYNLSKTHELALNKTQSRESNYLDHKLLKIF